MHDGQWANRRWVTGATARLRLSSLQVPFIEALRHRLSGVVSRVQQVSTEEHSMHSAHSW